MQSAETYAARFDAQAAAFQIAEIHVADASHRAMLANGAADRDVERFDVPDFLGARWRSNSRRGERKEHEPHDSTPQKTKRFPAPLRG